MVKIGIIGCGHWGINYVRTFLFSPQIEQVVCFDQDSSKMEKIKKNFPQVKLASSLNEMMEDKDIKAVVVSTPASTHYNIVMDAINNDKHILCEKPFTLEVNESQDLIEMADKKKLTLMVAHTFLYNPAIRWIKDFIGTEECGKLYYLQSTRTHLGLIRDDVSALWDLVPHDIAIFSYWLQKDPVKISAFGGCFLHPEKEDAVFINLEYPGGIIANIHASWMDAYKVRQINLVGSNTRITFDDINNLERVKIYEKGIGPKDTNIFGEFQYQVRDGRIICPKIEMAEPLKMQCEHFIDCVINSKRPFTDGKNGLEVVRIMKAIERSIKQNGTVQQL